MSSTIISLPNKLKRSYERACAEVLKKYELAQISFDIIMFLANNPEYNTAQEVSDYRLIKKNLVSVHVDRLVEAGYLERRTVPGDRRKIALAVTEKASSVVEAGREAQSKFIGRLTEGIPEEDVEAYRAMLEIIAENADKI